MHGYKIHLLRENGMTFAQIGRVMGVTRAAANKAYWVYAERWT